MGILDKRRRGGRWLLPVICPAVLSLHGYQDLVLRTNVHAVEVSIIATDAKSAPAAGLTADDFRVWDNGKEQTVAHLERISARAVPGSELPPHTYANRIGKTGQPQVLSMILLDAVNTKFRNQTVARRAVEDILKEIQPADRVAIYAFGSHFRVIHDFSSDKESLLARLKAYHGEVPDRDDLLEDLDLDVLGHTVPGLQKFVFDSNRIVDTLGALEAIANHVKGVPGRKNLLWVSAAFPVTAGYTQRTFAPRRGDPAPSLYQAFGAEMKQAKAALNDANISVYPIDARGLSINPAAFINIGTMREIADATGGKAYFDRNDLPRGVRLALEDSREVYLLTYYPQSLVQDGGYHQIRLQTARRGIELRYRHGYYAPGKEGDSKTENADSLTRAIASPLDASEIGIQARADSGAADDVAVTVRVDPADLNLTLDAARWTGALRLQAIQIGADGDRLGGMHQEAELNLEPGTYQRALEHGLTFEMQFKREPAAVAVRIAVTDERGGHVGSVSVPLAPQR